MIQEQDFTQAEARKTLEHIIDSLHIHGPVSAEDLERLSLIKKFAPEVFQEYEPKVIALLGLFYKTSKPNSVIETVYNDIAESIKKKIGTQKSFTPVQAGIYKGIKDNLYYSFSAPTSAGKSFLFRELILNSTKDIVIIVPSRALVTEYMFSVLNLLRDYKDVLVLEFIELVNTKHTKRNVFIITPERAKNLFKYKNQFNIELFLFDEAQLSDEKSARGVKFDSLVRRCDKNFPLAKKVFAHPFISNPDAQIKKHSFNEASSGYRAYNQNSVGKIYLSHSNGKFTMFSPYSEFSEDFTEVKSNEIESIINTGGTMLVYISKAKIYDGRYITEFQKYIDLCQKVSNPKAINIIDELAEYIGADKDKESDLITFMKKGIVTHHGSIPLKARMLIEKFVNEGHANICFATSTLIQGINMPFDLVWIDYFSFKGTLEQKILGIRNLIGRAGRSTLTPNSFDYGYVVVHKANKDRFIGRITQDSCLEEVSVIESYEKGDFEEDTEDTIEAIRADSFNDDFNLTDKQVERISKSDLDDDIKYILDTVLKNNIPMEGAEYYALSQNDKRKVSTALKKIYSSHLKRTSLNTPEQHVLSTSIPILLWRIQGKSFKEILSLRYSFLTRVTEQRELIRSYKRHEITKKQLDEKISNLQVKLVAAARQLPDSKASGAHRIPGAGKSIRDFRYDILVYDTYDYLDKVLALSLTDPISAAFELYFKKTADPRAMTFSNYIRYGTDDDTEIWLMKYGFDPEDIEWIKENVEEIDEKEIIFSDNLENLSSEKFSTIERFIV